jgi:hypothetical protein
MLAGNSQISVDFASSWLTVVFAEAFLVPPIEIDEVEADFTLAGCRNLDQPATYGKSIDGTAKSSGSVTS